MEWHREFVKELPGPFSIVPATNFFEDKIKLYYSVLQDLTALIYHILSCPALSKSCVTRVLLTPYHHEKRNRNDTC